MSDDYFCVCDEEWCWCTNRVGSIDEACSECAEGRHVMTPPDRARYG